MDYDLSRLSSRTFEHLVQALAFKFLGPEVSIFGDGADGGREASFDKLSAYPSSDAPWSAYGVIQAKFRQRLTSSGADSKWVQRELEKELKKFTSVKRGLKSPRYYIIATNVTLSPVSEVGGKDRVNETFERYKNRVGIYGYKIWDYDELRTMLDSSPEIRSTYNAWLMPGDVLAILLGNIGETSAVSQFKKIIVNYIQKELHSDEFVRLGQAGATDRDSTKLSKVFIDLPIDESSDHGASDAGRRLSSIKSMNFEENLSIRILVHVGNDRLARSVIARNLKSDVGSVRDQSGRIVFLGGPGQGKTTLSQFVCQLHRAAALKQMGLDNFLPDTRSSVESVLRQAASEGIDCPNLARFPFRIVLNSFAADLSEGKVSTIVEYLAIKIKQRTGYGLSCDALRSWLKEYPWLVVLDGLDEVPSSSNRGSVMSAVQDFLIDINDLDADVLLIATTRPQGYNDEFSPENFSHRYLSPLTVPQALRYAGKLVNQRWGSDQDKALSILSKLSIAGEEESTARLMRSPLQVTIMSLLVETLGVPPRERWRLFREYFSVITRREKERSIPSAELLNSYEPDINYMHKEVGFELQRISERSGHTDATLRADKFAEIVRRRLANEGHGGANLSDLESRITTAALERLVFLVSPVKGFIGFEIRSLQEFMASEYITDAPDSEIIKSLNSIALAPHWRNVFLFAAGRCFHEKQHLRGDLHQLICSLNERLSGEGALAGSVLEGSQLALEILEDGSLLKQPDQLRLYTRLALRLVELPSAKDLLSLSQQYRVEHRDIFEQVLDTSSSAVGSSSFTGAWLLLSYLSSDGIVWADSIIEKNWPNDLSVQLGIVSSLDRVGSSVLSKLTAKACSLASPAKTFDALSREDGGMLSQPDVPAWISTIIENENTRWDNKVKIEGVGDLFSLCFCSISSNDSVECISSFDSKGVDGFDGEVHIGWDWLRRAARFCNDPSVTELAALIKAYPEVSADGEFVTFGNVSKNIPWPLGSLIHDIRRGADALEISRHVEDGFFGDVDDWLAAQSRWARVGATVFDIEFSPSRGFSFDKEIRTVGFPIRACGGSVSHGSDLPVQLDRLVEVWARIDDEESKKFLSGQILFVASVVSGMGLSPLSGFLNDFYNLICSSGRSWLGPDILASLNDDFWAREDAIATVEKFGSKSLMRRWVSGDPRIARFGYIEDMLTDYSEQPGISNCLAAACALGYRPRCSAKPELDSSRPGYKNCVIVMLAAGLEPEICIDQSLVSDDVFISRLCSIVSRDGISNSYLDEFILKVFKSLPHDDYYSRQKVFSSIKDVQKRRVSGFDS